MKKVKVILVLILSLMMITSCGVVHQDNKYNTDADTLNNDINTLGDDLGFNIGAIGNINNLFSHDTIECRFYSIEDMETYLFTGSTQPSDYTNAPEFENIPKIDYYETYEYARTGYISLKDVYGIEVDKIVSFNSVTFQITTDCVIFTYYFDNNCITVTYSPGCFVNMSTSDYYAAYCDYSSTPYSSQDYVESSNVIDGYVLRKVDGKEVMYTYKNGIPRLAGIMVGDYFLSVTTAASSDVNEAYDEYSQFINSEEFAPISSIFADDSAVLSNAVQIIGKIDAK